MDKTVNDVLETLNEEQQIAVSILLSSIENDSVQHSDDEFIDCEEFMHSAFTMAKRDGSLKQAVIEHAAEYGITNIEELFPEAYSLNKEPQFLEQDVEWADTMLKGCTKLPFARVKQLFAFDETRARGYKKGNEKLDDEYITTSNRSIEPTTVYKKTKIDRDDEIDITDFEAANFIRTAMKGKLDEEIARAMIVGDGREIFSDDKIDESCIIPIATDDDVMAVKIECEDSITNEPENFIDIVIRNRKKYKGSGNPIMFMDEDSLSEVLLLKDNNGRRIYKSVQEIASELRVSKIITIADLFDIAVNETETHETFVQAIMVNPKDYAVGQDKGGKTTMFDQFDIDFNQQKYLIETRLSGGLTKPESALVFRTIVKKPVEPEQPEPDTSNPETPDEV